MSKPKFDFNINVLILRWFSRFKLPYLRRWFLYLVDDEVLCDEFCHDISLLIQKINNYEEVFYND